MRKRVLLSCLLLILVVFGSVEALNGKGINTKVWRKYSQLSEDSFNNQYNNIYYGSKGIAEESNKESIKNIFIQSRIVIGGEIVEINDHTKHKTNVIEVSGNIKRLIDSNDSCIFYSTAQVRYDNDSLYEDMQINFIPIKSITFMKKEDYERRYMDVNEDKNKDMNFNKEDIDFEKSLDQSKMDVFLTYSVLHNKELAILKDKLPNDKYNSIIFVETKDLLNNIEYLRVYNEHCIKELRVGDKDITGIYINEAANEVYVVSIKEDKVYTYNL
ncbi:MAG: hypothetical protein GXZ08_09775 [Tissierellia bacterium]|nr:hypothetical protein [Tissierellia bacterium]